MVARERFELSSAGPEPAMLDRYTTGLQLEIVRFFVISFNVEHKSRNDNRELLRLPCNDKVDTSAEFSQYPSVLAFIF